MSVLDILAALPQVLAWGTAGTCALLLIVAACAPRAATLTTDDTPSRLDTLDRPDIPTDYHLTEWDLDHDTHHPADLCDTYPWECDTTQESPGPDPWAPTTSVCHTHHCEGADR